MAAPQKPSPAAHLAAYATVQRSADRDILRLLREAYRDVNKDLQRLSRASGTGATVRREQLQAVKRDILERQAEFFRASGKIVEARRVEAAARAIQVAGRYDTALFALGGREEDARRLGRALEETELRSVDAAIARMNGSSVPLARRVYRTQSWTNDRLERRVNSALARGLTVQEFAREMREFVNPNTPGGTRYAALRLARTEINNAYHAMAIQAALRKPWIKKMEWHTSGSHSKPDECDALNGRLFVPAEVPRKPHPMCMCYITPSVVDPGQSEQEAEDEFLDSLLNGEFDSALEQYMTPEEVRQSREVVTVSMRPHVLVRGHDRTAEVLEDFNRLITPGDFFLNGENRYTEAENKGFGDPRDLVLTELVRLQGYGLPEVLDSNDIDRRISEGWTVGFRGVRPRGNASASQQVDSMRDDPDFELGSGIYGNGIYFSVEERVAQEYAVADPDAPKAKTTDGAVVRVVLSPTARVIEYHELIRQQKEFLSDPDMHTAIKDTLHDPGRFAAMRGYDAIIVENEQDGTYIRDGKKKQQSKALQFVILNRGVMAVERQNR